MEKPLLDELLARLRHPQVRDLAWALLSPPLLRDCPRQRHPLAASRWLHQPGLLADWLLALEVAPAVLENWLANTPTRRLGIHYERLWQFAIEQAPDVQLLAANLPIRRQGHTLGELDLLVRDAEGVQHIELAVKLYLGIDRADGRQWIGPDAKDRLDLKLAHLHQHQLELAHSPDARPALASLNIETLNSRFWLGGYLFYPAGAPASPPHEANPAHLRGRWITRQQALQLTQQPPLGRWQTVERARWLAPAEQADAWDVEQFQRWLAESPSEGRPQLIARFEPTPGQRWSERERMFVVGDHWPD